MHVLPLATVVALATALPSLAATSAQRCETAAAAALTSCAAKVAARVRHCYLDTGGACSATDSRITGALAKLETKVLGKCPDAVTVQAAGLGALLTPAALVSRLRESCLGDPGTLAARTFGGPQASLLAGADATLRDCLDVAYREGAKLQKRTLKVQSACIRKAHASGACDTAKTASRTASAESRAADAIAAACPAFKETLGMDVATFVARAGAQARCMTATSHGDTGPLALDCGPRAGVPVPPRGTWVQVVLDEAVWGTRCGKGAPYAFWLRLAPNGSPVDRVITDMAGGGVCIFEADCASIPSSLFLATDDGQPAGGYLSTNPSVNPFHDWTMLYMPYCNQDVHIGGGLSSVFSPTLTVYRYGAVNVRAALRYLRDVLWAEMDATDPVGWRPDRLTVFFAGESAGAFGVQYNYHYPLDDLRWIHTTAVPDSGLALDNGGAGVRVLGSLITTETNPLGWGTRPYQPTYCQTPDCAVGPELQAITSPRLKAVPLQQILNLSNQVDNTQVSTTLFANTPAWINALRTTYCTNQDLPGLRYFHPAVSSSIHTMLRSDARFTGLAAGGVTLRDFLAAAFADPDGVVDRVDEGTLVADFPGTNPIPCVGSASGAFL